MISGTKTQDLTLKKGTVIAKFKKKLINLHRDLYALCDIYRDVHMQN